MKTRNRIVVIAMILVIVTIIQVLPIQAFAFLVEELNQSINAIEFISNGNEESTEDVSAICEDESRRGLSSKQFRKSDGTFVVASYNEQVHYVNENGEFKDINNRLEYAKENKNGDFKGFENTDNVFTVKFNETLSNDAIYRISDGDYSITLGAVLSEEKMGNGEYSKAEIIQSDNPEKPVENDDTEIGTLFNITSYVVYKDADINTDYRYTLSGTHIKDYIVVKERQDSYNYTFTLDLENLTYSEDDFGGIVFKDGEGNIKYSIPAPYMYDNNGALSYEIFYQIEENEEKIILRVIVSEEWINAEERVFPVTIDPEIYYGDYTTSQNASVADAEVLEGSANTTMGNSQYMHIGYNANTAKMRMRAYTKLNSMPSIPNSAIIIEAKLNIRQYAETNNSPTDNCFYYNGNASLDDQILLVAAREVTEQWDEASICWTNKPDDNSIIVDYIKVTEETQGQMHHFDITKSAQKWFKEGECKGLAIYPVEEYTSGSEYAFANFYAREADNQTTTEPFYTFVYRDNRGLEDYWRYNSFDVGEAGAAYINDFSGNLVFVGPAIDADYDDIPISVYPVYNTYSENVFYRTGVFGVTGYGWMLNVQEKIYEIDGLDYYIYVDSDGTEHYFKKIAGENTADDEDHLGMTITKVSTNQYTLTYGDDSYIKYFDDKGLTKIKNGDSEVDFVYSSYFGGYRLSGIYAGNEALFTFTNNSITGFYSIANNKGETVYYHYSYDYNSGISDSYASFLRQIVFDNGTPNDASDDRTINIDYLSNTERKITTVNDGNNKIELFYANGSPSEIKQYIIADNTEHLTNDVKTDFSGNKATSYRTWGANSFIESIDLSSDDVITRYSFDNMGHTISEVTYRADGKEFYGSNAYYYDSDLSLHRIIGQTDGGGGSTNINENILFDTINAGSYTGYTVSADAQTKYIGAQSLKINATAATSSAKVYSTAYPATNQTGNMVISGYIKTSGINNGSAYIAVKHSGSVVAKTQVITGDTSADVNNGWQKVYASFNMQYLSGYTIEYTLDSDIGTAWFDLIQVDYADDIPQKSNLLINGGFYDGAPYGYPYWISIPFATVNYDISSPVSTLNRSLKLDGNPGTTSYVGQSINIHGNSDETYSFSGWTRADSVPVNTSDLDEDRSYSVESVITLRNKTTNEPITLDPQVTDINTDSSDWQYFVHPVYVDVTGRTDITEQNLGDYMIYSVTVGMRYKNNANSAYFTGLSLSRSAYEKYEYNENGDLTQSLSTSEGDRYVITYDNEGKPHATRISGKDICTLEYDPDTNNLTREIYSDGSEVIYTYVQKEIWSLNENNECVSEITYLPSRIDYKTNDVIRNRYDYWYSSVRESFTINGITEEKAVYWYCDDDTFYIYDETGTLLEYKETDYSTHTKDGERFELTDEICTKYSGGYFKCRQVFEYDTNYHLVKEEYRNITNNIFYIKKYTYNGDNLTSETDQSGKTTSYTYDEDDRISTKTDANGGVTTYTYDNDGNVASMNFSGGTIDTTVNYGYNDYGISEIDANTDYEFTYDVFGNKTGVKIVNGISNLDLVTYEYNTNGTLYYKHYANGWYERYEYDNNGNVRKIFKETSLGSTQSSPEIENIYSENGLLIEHRDNANNTKTVYEYNGDGEVLRSIQYSLSGGNTKLQSEIVYNGTKPERLRYFYENEKLDEIIYTYNDNSLLINYSTVAGETEFDYNALDQLTTKAIETVNNVTLTETYTYKTTTIDNVVSTSDLIATVQLADGTVFGYTYDSVGNITSVTENGVPKASYEYDALGQLTRENNAYANKTYVFTYDNYGNILSKAEYAYTTGSLGTPDSTIVYTYGDSLWKDKLTAYNGVSITYDAMGNPLSYNNGSSYTFTWKNGRELASLSTGTTSVTYNYNADSVRIKKTVNGVVHEYVVDGYKILEEKYGSNVLKFTYDENDSPQSINFWGTTYYYGKNLQGDIVKIYDANGNAIAEYTYDAWGNTISTSYTNIFGSLMLSVNPFRYRGYYYDTESGLYYLNSRYYDAKVGRFINADDPELLGATGTTLSFALYSYCEHNYINSVDYYGYDAILIYDKDNAFTFGHIGLFIQYRSEWYYWYWGPHMLSIISTYTIKILYGIFKDPYYTICHPIKTLIKSVSSAITSNVKPDPILEKINAKINKGIKKEDINYYAFYYFNYNNGKTSYTDFLYLTGNFDKGYTYLSQLCRSGSYNLIYNNCMETSIEALKRGKFSSNNFIKQVYLNLAKSMVIPKWAFSFLNGKIS